MNNSYRTESIVLGILLFLGLATLGYFISKAAYQVKSADRVVTVKGLAEKEVKADAKEAESTTEVVKLEPVLDAQGRAYGTGRRKATCLRHTRLRSGRS